nr:ubiquitin hydrolase [Tanacetum cinerariifolium]
MMKKSSNSEDEPCCSKDCMKNTDSLNNKIKDLKSKLSEANTYWYSYKLGVAQLEERLNEYKEREEKYIVKIRTLEMYRASNLDSIKILTNEVETNKNSTTAENGESTDSILSKPAVKFVKAGDRPAERITTNKAKFVKATERPTTDKVGTAKKPAVRYAEMYRRTSKRSTVRGNQRNWNNLKSQQLGPDFAIEKKACYNCGDFSHLANDCRKKVQRETTRSQNHAYKSPSHRSYGAPMRPLHRLLVTDHMVLQ